MQRRTKLITIYLIFVFSTLAFADGGKEGHGGDIVDLLDHVWFFGDPVEYCISVSPDFPQPPEPLEAKVKIALTKWVAFLDTHGISQKTFHRDKNETRISTEFVLVDDCTNPHEQIEFVFGGTHPLLEKHKGRFNHSIGGSINWSSDPSRSPRQGGVVYIPAKSSQWPLLPNPFYLDQILLHEVGHIFGFPHDSVAIMSKNFAINQISGVGFLQPPEIEVNGWQFAPIPNVPIIFGDRNFKNYHVDRCLNLIIHLPAEIRNLVSDQTSNCASIHLTYLYSNDLRHYWNLQVVSHQRVLATMKGILNGPMTHPSAPHVVEINKFKLTLPFFLTAPTKEFPKIEYGGVSFSNELTGYFEIGSERVGAILDNRRNHKLKIFFPNSGIWWEVGGDWL